MPEMSRATARAQAAPETPVGPRPSGKGAASRRGEGRVEAVYPLSPLQEGMLFHCLAEEGGGLYVDQVAATLVTDSGLDPARFERALRAVSVRHAVLRTVFVWDLADRPQQVVLRDAGPAFAVVDLTALDAEAVRRERECLRDRDRRRGFALDRPPLVRCLAVMLPGGEVSMVLTYSHLLMDAWSLMVVLEEFVGAYLQGGRLPARERVLPYEAFIRWLERRDERAAAGFWREYLMGISSPIRLDPGLAGGAESGREGVGEDEVLLSPEDTSRVTAAAGRHRLTLAALAHGALGLVLSRYSGATDVLFGSVVSGRPTSMPGVEKIVGLFINTLPVRVLLPAGVSLRESLQDLHAGLLQARSHQHSPLTRVQSWSEIPGDQPFFESLLVFESSPMPEKVGAGGRLSLLGAEYRTQTNYPLTLFVTPGECLSLRVLYDRRRITATSAGRMLEHLQAALRAFATDLERPPEAVPLLSAAQRHQLLLEWNRPPEAAVEKGWTLPEAVEGSARSRPEAIAVVSGGEAVSYAEILRRARRVAASLRALGIGVGGRVAVLLERNADLPAALLGVQAAGAAYVPLDPTYPAARLSLMLEDCRPACLLVSRSAMSKIPEDADASVPRLCVEDVLGSEPSLPEPRKPSESSESPPSFPDRLAYVIYTSGSTGRPKGVGVPHRPLGNFLASMAEQPGFREGESLLAVTSLSFDIAALELFLPLVTGGRVVIASAAEAVGAWRLRTLLEAVRPTALQATPATWRMLLTAGGTDLPWLRALCGGEALTLGLAEALVPRVGELWNLYGPTETTVWSAVERIGAGQVTIGRPIAATAVHIVTPDLRLAPPGTAGDLTIAGAGLARGYLGRPRRTAAAFLPSPWGPPGSRLYRTGDLGRRLPDGRLECLGRSDSQVKLRGHRIELGEIEAAVASHPGVSAAVAAVWRHGEGDQRLIAYWTRAEGEKAEAEGLEAWCRERLPAATVPGLFVRLERLPLTPNLKIDRSALPDPGEDRGPGHGWLQGPIEMELAGIWEDVLGVEGVEPTDHFFRLGGHSLLVTRATVRIREAFGIELPMRDFFEHPRLEELARRVEIALRGREGHSPPPPFEPGLAEGRAVASLAQERMLMLQQLAPESTFYLIPLAVGVEGPLEVHRLRAALGRVLARHAVLRTGLRLGKNEVEAWYAAPAPCALPVVDLSRVTGVTAAAFQVRPPLALDRPPLWRSVLLRFAPETHALLLDLHHVAADEASLELLLRDLAVAYRSPEALEADAIEATYSDFALWQRRWLEGEVVTHLLAYWRERLEGVPALELPTDRPRPAVQSYRGRRLPRRLMPAAARGLETLARRGPASPFMALLAAFQALLTRMVGNEDVVVGMPVGNRPHRSLERCMGLFVNTLPLRTRIPPTACFREILASVRSGMLDAMAHQDLSFERMVEALGLERDLSRNPLVQVLFNLVEAARLDTSLGEARLRLLEEDRGTTQFDLQLNAGRGEHGTSLSWEYATDLFDASTIERLADRYERLLCEVSKHPERPLGELSLLSASEAHQMRWEWGQGEPVPDVAPDLPGWIEARSAGYPERVALVMGEAHLTYGALVSRARDVAAALAAMGVGVESRVALLAERSAELVPVMLGIQRAGGAYVPLDPSLPGRRLALILEDCAPHALVTDAATRPEDLGLEVGDLPRIPLGANGRVPAGSPAGRIAPPAGTDLSDRLAYVLFTSGSTGRPKGVGIPHRALTRFLAAMMEEPAWSPDDRQLAVASLAFDMSVSEIFAPLLSGSRIEMAGPDDVGNPERLGALIAERRISSMQATPSTWGMLREGAWPGPGHPFRVQIGGEPLSPSLAEFLAGRVTELWNIYGPTEITVYCTHNLQDIAETINIGRPIHGIDIQVADRRLRRAPVGVVGELVVGGPVLARGYVGRPRRTAPSFVPSPWGEPGARLYRTGDLGRFLPDGRLECLGRRDHQVKLRGHRIELGEVEVILGDHPAVMSTVALIWEKAPGDQRLVVYWVPEEGAEAATEELEAWCRNRLPAVMAPSRLIRLDSMPLTANRKVDRAALPSPSDSEGGRRSVFRGPVEEQLAGIWAEVLGVEAVTPEDHFFELGGHSLLVTRATARVRESFGVEFSIRSFFEHPQLAELAREVEAALHDRETEPIEPAALEGPLPLSYSQQRLWVLDRLYAGSSEAAAGAYNVTLAARLRGRLSYRAFARALSAVVERHAVLRTVYREHGSGGAQIVLPPAPVPLPVVDLEALPPQAGEAAAEGLLLRHARLPFDLAVGPVIRMALLRLGREEHRGSLVVHHVASDGWSSGLLAEELSILYETFADGRTPSLPALPIQYADFAAWQRRHLNGDELERQVDFWRRTLEGAPETTTLRPDHPRPEDPQHRGRMRYFALGAETVDAVRRLCREEGVTLYMALLAGFQTLLYHHTGQEDLVVGSPVAGRERLETEPLVGYFVSTLPVRTRIARGLDFRGLLGRVREAVLAVFAHQTLPLEKLLDELRPPRVLGRSPLFQVVLTFQNTPMPARKLPGLELAFEPVRSETAKFDVTVNFWEEGEGITGYIEHDVELYEDETIRCFWDGYEPLLARLAAEPDLPLSDSKGEGGSKAAAASEVSEAIGELEEAEFSW